MSEITTAQYTPGPWRVFGYEVVDAKDQRVASTTTPSRPHPEERANACLIAAAPDMLDVLRRIRQWDHLESVGDGPYWCRALDVVIRVAETGS